MTPRTPRHRIQPKLRAMPLRKTPSAIYIQMHQLANEKERLQEEWVRLQERQQLILKRLQELDRDLAQLETDATENALSLDLPQAIAGRGEAQHIPPQQAASHAAKKIAKQGRTFDSMTIDY